MINKKRNYLYKPPCPKCPYTLGQVHTLVNPCFQCKAEDYQMFERFNKRMAGYYVRLPSKEKSRRNKGG